MAEVFKFRVTGVDDNTASRRNYTVQHEEEFEIRAESVGDALNDLVNRSGMWETLDMAHSFSIEFLGG